jgi:DNA-binding Lrp family transcriptional regulator
MKELRTRAQRANLTKLLFALIKNSKRSDRELARALQLSQPTVTRLRKILEKEAIEQYTVIPNLSYLGFDLISFTFSTSKELVDPLEDKAKKWTAERPSVMFASTGQGMDADAVMVSVHRDYADFAKFYQKFRRDWGGSLHNFRTFLVSVKGSVQLKALSPNCLVESYAKGET